jgi:hypothetical protein
MISLDAEFRSRKGRVVTLTLFFSATLALLTQGQEPAAKLAVELIRPQGIDGTLVIGGGGTIVVLPTAGDPEVTKADRAWTPRGRHWKGDGPLL